MNDHTVEALQSHEFIAWLSGCGERGSIFVAEISLGQCNKALTYIRAPGYPNEYLVGGTVVIYNAYRVC